MARLEDRPEGPRIAALQRSHGRADAFVLGLDMTHASWLAGFELAASIGVARLLVRVPFTGVEHEDRNIVGQLDAAMLERAAVEQERCPFASE
jgi:hypothetical protein